MLADCFPIEFNSGRRETPQPDGSRIVFIPGKTNRWLAINAMGVRIGGYYSSESLAQSALNDQIVATPEPPKRAGCSHCRSGYHTVADCPVKAAEGERIAAARKAKDMATSTSKRPENQTDADYLSAVRRLDSGSGATAADVRSDVDPSYRDLVTARRALDRLTTAGKLTRTVNGKKAARYRVAERDVPAPDGSRVLVAEDPPTPPEILDPDVPRPEEPTECAAEEDAPYVCPGCHAVGEAPCSPTSGCPEAEIGSESSASLLEEVLGPIEDDDDDPDAPDPWDSWLPDVRQSADDVSGPRDDSADVSTVGAYDAAQGSVSAAPATMHPLKALSIIRVERRLRDDRDKRVAELREAVRVLRALADVGEGLIAEVGR